MTQVEKELLLRDLCAKLLYGVKVWHLGVTRELLGIIPSTENVMVGYDINDYEDSVIEDIKPYLRPMSSMTEEEIKELLNIDTKRGIFSSRHLTWYIDGEIVDYLNKKMFDWRGLIPKGLAIEVTKENNPYK